MQKFLTICRWALGGFFVLGTLALFSSQEYLGACFCLIVSLFILPLNALRKKVVPSKPQVHAFVSPEIPTNVRDGLITQTIPQPGANSNTSKSERLQVTTKVDLSKAEFDDSVFDDEREQSRIVSHSYGYAQTRLGDKYKQKLQLNAQEVLWLNKFWDPANIFLAIEGCCIATMEVYLDTIKGIERKLTKDGTSLQKEVEFFKEELSKPRMMAGWSDYEKQNASERMEANIYYTIFRKSERAVRMAFKHKRQIAAEFPYTHERLRSEFECRIGATAERLIAKLVVDLKVPDEDTEMQLNTVNINRWKVEYEQLSTELSDATVEQFVKNIHELARVNARNPALENIFFEASKTIARHDRGQGLKFYIHYLYHDLHSDRFDERQLTKNIQKSLFKTNEQLHHFEEVVANLLKTKDLDKALIAVEEVYQPKRRRIELDRTLIDEVQQQDRHAVGLLNEYLQDNFEDETTRITSKEINSEEVSIEIIPKHSIASNGAVASKIIFNPVQEEILDIFRSAAFNVSKSKIDDYCNARGMFTNQVIDSINEICYELLDDNLIEEVENKFTIQNAYYYKIKPVC